MIEWKNLTDHEIDALDRRLPVIVPIGLVEAHGPHLAVSVDMDTAEYFAREIASRSGAIVAPMIAYGFADEMAGYPGTIGVRAQTLIAVARDIAEILCAHGFQRIVFLSGHGANRGPIELSFWDVWQRYPNARLAYWNWWTEGGVSSVHHADEHETGVALAVGTTAYMERVQDFTVEKPWYKLRSRHALDALSGGINGTPSRATHGAGETLRDEIVETLSRRMQSIVQGETADHDTDNAHQK